MAMEISSIRGYALSGWHFGPMHSCRLELYAIDLASQAGTKPVRCEVLFRSPSAVSVELRSVWNSPVIIEDVRSTEDDGGGEQHVISLGSHGSIELKTTSHVVLAY